MIEAPTLLFERSGVAALVKPAGLPTQAPAGIVSLETWMRDRLVAGAYLGIPHRLDRAVSGVVLLATTPRAARKLSRQFERREIGKTYLAIVAAPNTDPSVLDGDVVWRDRIAKVADEARATVAGADDPAARDAETLVRRLGSVDDAAWGVLGPAPLLLELRPRTGRMHQLRVQCAARGMPVVGDSLYGGPPFPVPTAEDPRELPIALHSLSIRYRDPDGDEERVATAPPPLRWPAAAVRLAAGS